MPASQLVLLARFAQTLSRKFVDGLEHPEAVLVADSDEALVDQRLQLVDVGVADPLGGLERAPTAENRQAREQTLLVGFEQVVRPLDRGTQRLLADFGIAATLEQV